MLCLFEFLNILEMMLKKFEGDNTAKSGTYMSH